MQSLLRCLEGEAAVPGTVKKARPATSARALARADTNDSVGGDSSDSTGNRSLHATLDEALAHTSNSQQLTAPGCLSAKSEDANQPDVTAESLLEQEAPAEAALHAAQTADGSGASAAASLGSGKDTHSPVSGLPSVQRQAVQSEVAEATANIAFAAETAQPLQQECALDNAAAAAAAVADSDYVSNPLYEEPDPLRPIPIAAADPALPHEIAKGESNGSALQLEASSAGEICAPKRTKAMRLHAGCPFGVVPLRLKHLLCHCLMCLSLKSFFQSSGAKRKRLPLLINS